LRVLLAPAGFLFEAGTAVRNWAFDHGLFKSQSLDCPVIGIGNVTAGGTGKTPTVELFIRILAAAGKRVGVVSRGYGGSVREVARVRQGTGIYYGDEPMMLANKFPEVPVYVGPHRVRVAQELIRNENVDVILVDDSFQHRWLSRDLNVLLIDATQPVNDYRPIPWGMGRESLPLSLRRADLIIITKSKLLSPAGLAAFGDWFERQVREGHYVGPVLKADYKLHSVRSLDSKSTNSLAEARLVSALARPEGFERLIRLQSRIHVTGHSRFADHHYFTQTDVEHLEHEFSDSFLTSEKDAIKLAALTLNPGRWWVTEATMNFTDGGEEQARELLSRFCR